MMNKILALKYRPQEFKDLIGQEVMSQTITNAIKLGKNTKLLHDQWSKNVGLDIFQQIRDYSKECKILNLLIRMLL